MGTIISIPIRVWQVNYPPQPPKLINALRFGILGTPWIASLALITPAKSHPGIIIAAVASRDLDRAKAYAKKFHIPNSDGSYEVLVEDTSIDAVYIALPNSLHYEWTIRALTAGKHILLEKPSVSNAIEAESLFNFHAPLSSSSRPVLLEAFHSRFHPAWHKYLSCISPKEVESVYARLSMPVGFFLKGNIRWDFDLSGGSLMDIGTYSIAALRDVFLGELIECMSAEARLVTPPGDQRIDEGSIAEFMFPNGGVGTIEANIRKTSWWGLPGLRLPRIVVKQRAKKLREYEGAGTR